MNPLDFNNINTPNAPKIPNGGKLYAPQVNFPTTTTQPTFPAGSLQAASGVQPKAAPKVDTSPTPVNKLTQNNPTIAPVTNTQATDAFAMTGNKVVEQASQKPVEEPITERQKLLNDFQSLQEKQAEQGQRTLDLQKEQALADKQAELNKINAEAITVDRAYEKQKRALEKNPEGVDMAELNNRVSQLSKTRNEELADIGIRQAVAQGNVELANKIVETAIKAEFEPIANQIESLKTYQQLRNNDLTDSEKTQLDSLIRKQEMDYQFGLDSRLLAKKQQYSLQEAGLLQAQQNEQMLPNLYDKVGKIDSLIEGTNNSGAVGTNPLARTSLTNWITGNRDNFIAGVEQLVSADTLDTLINLKKAGGTLGALSDGERGMLQSAASKIGTWRQEKDGKVTGYKVSEKAFADELKTIKMLTNRAILEAGGSINSDPLGLGVKEDPLNLGI